QHIYYHDIEKLFLSSRNNPSFHFNFNKYRSENGINEILDSGVKKGSQLLYQNILQTNFFKIPGYPIAYWVSKKRLDTFSDFKSVKDVAEPKVGMLTTSNDLFMRSFWEVGFNKIGTGFKNKQEAIESQ